MPQKDNYSHSAPEESYSRELDSRVQSEEMPYGYDKHPAEFEDISFKKSRK